VKAQLYVLGGRDVGRSFDVEGGAVLGRDKGCEVRLGDRSVSRRHARLVHEGLDWYVEDLDSRNGLRVGGKRVRRAALEDRDEFLLGEVAIRLRIGERPADERDQPGLPAAAPADEELPEEILLEGAGPAAPVAPARPAPPATPVRAPVPPAPAATREAPPSRLASIEERREALLREGRHTGLLRGDLAQQPMWLRLVIALLLLGAGGAVVVLVYRSVTSVRETL
jgi:predicted component of type VI protein secretion system